MNEIIFAEMLINELRVTGKRMSQICRHNFCPYMLEVENGLCSIVKLYITVTVYKKAF